jgi:acyl-CoA synthetase (AMP-forming)/AMP-acid ligase II
LAILWACWDIGAVAVPLNWSWTAEQVAEAAAAAEMKRIVVDPDHRDRVLTHLALDLPPQFDSSNSTGGENNDRLPDEADPALIIFTSGTTAQPRGATFSHGAVISSLMNVLVTSGRLPDEIASDAPAPRSLLSYPVFHMAGIMNVVMSTVVGGVLVFPGSRFDPIEALDLIARERVTAWGAVPTMVQRAVEALDTHPVDLSNLRNITLGAAPMPPQLAELLAARIPSVRQRVANAYGMTETGGTIALCSGATATADSTCVGRPMPTVQLKVVVTDRSHTGEILVRTPSLMLGYCNDTSSPIDEDGWLHTGDIGYLDGENQLHITDRAKDMIIRGGENISPTAVEQALTTHPSVMEAAAFGVPDPDLGERIAVVVVTRDLSLTSDELIRHCRTTLARFEVPDDWWLRSAPLTRGTLQKVLRTELRREFLGGRDST